MMTGYTEVLTERTFGCLCTDGVRLGLNPPESRRMALSRGRQGVTILE